MTRTTNQKLADKLMRTETARLARERRQALIAAAPKLLEACEQYVSRGHHLSCRWYSVSNEECNCGMAVAQQAIALVKGGAS